MTVKELFDELEGEIQANRPFDEIFKTLKGFRQVGVSRQEVLQALESLRGQSVDESTEDRILEVMDLVSGFRRCEDSLWDD